VEPIDLGMRLLALAALSAATYRIWRMVKSPVVVDGKRYYHQPDGTYRTLWGKRITDGELISRVRALEQDAT
jgi:hypothetical protein